MFGAGAGEWKYDVSKYMDKIRKEIKPTAHTVHYLKELSEHSLPEPEPEELPPPVVEVVVRSPDPEPPSPILPPQPKQQPSGLLSVLCPFCVHV